MLCFCPRDCARRGHPHGHASRAHRSHRSCAVGAGAMCGPRGRHVHRIESCSTLQLSAVARRVVNGVGRMCVPRCVRYRPATAGCGVAPPFAPWLTSTYLALTLPLPFRAFVCEYFLTQLFFPKKNRSATWGSPTDIPRVAGVDTSATKPWHTPRTTPRS